MLKVIFMGTPDFAVPVLKAVNSVSKVVGVVTQPDRPRARTRALVETPVKVEAKKLGLRVFEYERVSRDGEDELRSLGADVIITCAYGQILRENILKLTRLGVYNVHGSILPKYRGAAPIARAIMNGESVTGITILKSDIGIDDGDVLFHRSLDILPDDTCGTLTDRLSQLGAECIVDAISMLESCNYSLVKQDDSMSTYAKMIKPEDEILDFNTTIDNVINKVRALNPKPCAKCNISGTGFKIFEVKRVQNDVLVRLNIKAEDFLPNTIVYSSSKVGLFVKCLDGVVEIVTLAPENGKMMPAKAYLNGKKIDVGSVINE